MAEAVSNPDDFKVVSFHNSEDFGFTPDMGCMYDGRAISGPTGVPGINPGEKMQLPYHIGHRLAINLAKRVLNTSQAASVDAKGIPTGVPIWNETVLKEKALSYITDLYSEEKPAAQSQTDLLMAKVEEYKKMVEDLAKNMPDTPQVTGQYQDKQEVIAELEKRGIAHDKRKNKAELEALLV